MELEIDADGCLQMAFSGMVTGGPSEWVRLDAKAIWIGGWSVMMDSSEAVFQFNLDMGRWVLFLVTKTISVRVRWSPDIGEMLTLSVKEWRIDLNA